ncbi:MAG: hypothetical protein GEV10_29045 [Streptosporangiales bacterium]|nr:hypothetical protein [Streptosporangiales bacterium]
MRVDVRQTNGDRWVSAQELDLSRSWGVLRRHHWAVAALFMVGMLAGLVAAIVFPAMPEGKALVVLPPPVVSNDDSEDGPTQDIETQVLIANSGPVLQSAGQNVEPALDVKTMKERVKVIAVTQDILEIRAKGTSPEQATTLANAVADTYVFYVTDSNAQLPGDLGKKIGARVLERATTTSGGDPYIHLAIFGLLGALGGGLIGSAVILAVTRGDRRLRSRDEIADALGIPVVASISSHRPKDAGGWADLLDRYEPTAVDAWSLRKTFHHLGVDARSDDSVSMTVVSFADDAGALAIGPQLAAFASSIGIDTDLVVDSRHEAVATLVAYDPTARVSADDAESAESDDGVADLSEGQGDPVALRVLVVVVDRGAPRLGDSTPAHLTLVAVSAGKATAEELARVAVATADDGRAIDGLVVADPDPTDRTTGGGPQARRRTRSIAPTPLSGTARGSRR